MCAVRARFTGERKPVLVVAVQLKNITIEAGRWRINEPKYNMAPIHKVFGNFFVKWRKGGVWIPKIHLR